MSTRLSVPECIRCLFDKLCLCPVEINYYEYFGELGPLITEIHPASELRITCLLSVLRSSNRRSPSSCSFGRLGLFVISYNFKNLISSDQFLIILNLPQLPVQSLAHGALWRASLCHIRFDEVRNWNLYSRYCPIFKFFGRFSDRIEIWVLNFPCAFKRESIVLCLKYFIEVITQDFPEFVTLSSSIFSYRLGSSGWNSRS